MRAALERGFNLFSNLRAPEGPVAQPALFNRFEQLFGGKKTPSQKRARDADAHEGRDASVALRWPAAALFAGAAVGVSADTPPPAKRLGMSGPAPGTNGQEPLAGRVAESLILMNPRRTTPGWRGPIAGSNGRPTLARTPVPPPSVAAATPMPPASVSRPWAVPSLSARPWGTLSVTALEVRAARTLAHAPLARRPPPLPPAAALAAQEMARRTFVGGHGSVEDYKARCDAALADWGGGEGGAGVANEAVATPKLLVPSPPPTSGIRAPGGMTPAVTVHDVRAEELLARLAAVTTTPAHATAAKRSAELEAAELRARRAALAATRPPLEADAKTVRTEFHRLAPVIRLMMASLTQPDIGLRPLTTAEVDVVAAALAPGGRAEELLAERKFVFFGPLELARRDLRFLRPTEWLNDEIINYYLSLLQEREGRSQGPRPAPRVTFLNTFFYNKLFSDKQAYGYDGVRRWTTAAKTGGYLLLDCELLVVPVHQGMHWVLAVIDLVHRRIEYWDSLGGRDPAVLANLLRWVEDETKNKRPGAAFDASLWTTGYATAPHQRNGYDCGVFMLKIADYVARSADLAWTQADLQYFRRRIAADLLDGNVEG